MQKDYFILDIKGGQHNIHGEIAFIKANPVMETKLGDRVLSRSAVDHYCNDTETFIIPADPIILHPIISEAQSNGGVWTAELSDYRDETTFDETNGRRIKVHMFKGF
jgi:hypothetical protein